MGSLAKRVLGGGSSSEGTIVGGGWSDDEPLISTLKLLGTLLGIGCENGLGGSHSTTIENSVSCCRGPGCLSPSHLMPNCPAPLLITTRL
jgi:hypothetical protein